MTDAIKELNDMVHGLSRPELTKEDIVPTQKINAVMERVRSFVALRQAQDDKTGALYDRVCLKDIELRAGRRVLQLHKIPFRSSEQDAALIQLAKITRELLELDEIYCGTELIEEAL